MYMLHFGMKFIDPKIIVIVKNAKALGIKALIPTMEDAVATTPTIIIITIVAIMLLPNNPNPVSSSSQPASVPSSALFIIEYTLTNVRVFFPVSFIS